MIFKLLVRLFCILMLVGVQFGTSAKSLGICRIYNEHFSSYVRVQFKLFNELQVCLEPVKKSQMVYSDEDPSGVWYLEPISTTANTTFLIRNRKYSQEYLRGSESFQEWPTKKNRGVFLEKMTNKKTSDEEFFVWTVHKVPESQHMFYITNVKLGLPLYARNPYPYKRTSLRILSLLNDAKQPKSDEFKWILKCREY